ncbi:hypothetical protein DUI87_08424 [Hirundo rustica rustica]|uniref:Uncharacterized protein n=1 Tax=Hirundo rustica rustica TaxID=333673 RepID=A0A3M0KZR9_HIRRU|nr:hypothetical protein DUI87_08424 [Hirundo rustica rustica]
MVSPLQAFHAEEFWRVGQCKLVSTISAFIASCTPVMMKFEIVDKLPAFMEELRKVKAIVKLNLERNVEGKKNFAKYINSKEKMRENTNPRFKGERDLVTKDMEQDEVQNAFLAPVFTGKICLQESQLSETPIGRSRKKRIYSG